MLHLSKNIKKNTCRWYDLQSLRYRAKDTEIGNFRSFFALLPFKNPKNQNFIIRYFKDVYQKSQSYDLRLLRYEVKQTEFFVILGHF